MLTSAFSARALKFLTGATLTGSYGGYTIEQEIVTSDPGLFQMNITGGRTRGMDGSAPTRVCPKS